MNKYIFIHFYFLLTKTQTSKISLQYTEISCPYAVEDKVTCHAHRYKTNIENTWKKKDLKKVIKFEPYYFEPSFLGNCMIYFCK